MKTATGAAFHPKRTVAHQTQATVTSPGPRLCVPLFSCAFYHDSARLSNSHMQCAENVI
jgi:hypothetical protein